MEKPILKDNHTSEDVQIYLNELFIYEKIQNKGRVPKTIDNINWITVIRTCENIVDSIVNGKYHEDDDLDNKHYVYEETMKAIYGDDIFDKLRKLK